MLRSPHDYYERASANHVGHVHVFLFLPTTENKISRRDFITHNKDFGKFQWTRQFEGVKGCFIEQTLPITRSLLDTVRTPGGKVVRCFQS
jgi:hypothetical protein